MFSLVIVGSSLVMDVSVDLGVNLVGLYVCHSKNKKNLRVRLVLKIFQFSRKFLQGK